MRSAASRLPPRTGGAARARRFQPTIAPPPSRADLRLALRHLREVVEVIDEEHRRFIEAGDVRIGAVDQVPFVGSVRASPGSETKPRPWKLEGRAGEGDAR